MSKRSFEPAPPVHERRRLVLAVDDEPLMRTYLRQVLGDLPLRLLCVDSAERAIEAIEAHSPAAVVSDHQLPGMSGIELLEEVRSRWPRIPVLLHTGDPAAQARASRLRLLAVEKGAPPEVLRAMVLLLLEPERAR